MMASVIPILVPGALAIIVPILIAKALKVELFTDNDFDGPGFISGFIVGDSDEF